MAIALAAAFDAAEGGRGRGRGRGGRNRLFEIVSIRLAISLIPNVLLTGRSRSVQSSLQGGKGRLTSRLTAGFLVLRPG